ncbi:helix-turn-helix domain-containing protein [Acinetobacter sp. ANC 4173]|uniref:helix-turn-helix domain-containing protein n=1 Tax=Acinetobacter sp. ANC 4173 TaxID=2529837 RepID=UPI0010389D03|nr:helix-turn-helix domain-containing protein [Acinetobacter sp. ANC 4173]TCB73593.1 DNA-binding protein [Acinetobacter sp. ANC 4173]
MSKVSISEAAKRFKVSRNTVYKRIAQGALTKDADGLLDVSDLLRVFSGNVQEQAIRTRFNKNDEQGYDHIAQQLEQVQQENVQLKQLLAVNEMLVNQLQQQITDLRQDKENLFNQLGQRRIESRDQPEQRKGLFSKLFG